MRRLLYIGAEWLVVWLIAVLVGWTFMFVTTGFAGLKLLLFLLYAFVAMGIAAKAVLFRSGNMSLAGGFYRPFRPVADIAQSGLLQRDDAHRDSIRIAYRDPGDMDPFEVVRRLSADLEAQGIAHSYSGHITATDGASRFRIAPALGDSAIEGWVEAPRQADRQQVISAVHAFIAETLALEVMEHAK